MKEVQLLQDNIDLVWICKRINVQLGLGGTIDSNNDLNKFLIIPNMPKKGYSYMTMTILTLETQSKILEALSESLT